MKYTIVIEWLEEDKCFVVFLPDFQSVMQPVTHGDTYSEALNNAQEVLELLTEVDNIALPQPQPFFSLIERKAC